MPRLVSVRRPEHAGAAQPDPQGVVGLVVPPQEGSVPTDAPLVYPDVAFDSIGLGLRRMEDDSYREASRRIVQRAGVLAGRGASAIAVMGTSLTFFRGSEGNREVEQAVRASTGLPCVTMSSALAAGLRSVGSRRPVLASAYSAAVHTQLANFLVEEGFDPAIGSRLDIVDLDELAEVSPRDIVDLGIRGWESAEESGDALVLSCGGFRTRGAMLLLEEALGVPVVSSAVAGLWAAVDAAGLDARVPALGRLLQSAPEDEHGSVVTAGDRRVGRRSRRGG